MNRVEQRHRAGDDRHQHDPGHRHDPEPPGRRRRREPPHSRLPPAAAARQRPPAPRAAGATQHRARTSATQTPCPTPSPAAVSTSNWPRQPLLRPVQPRLHRARTDPQRFRRIPLRPLLPARTASRSAGPPATNRRRAVPMSDSSSADASSHTESGRGRRSSSTRYRLALRRTLFAVYVAVTSSHGSTDPCTKPHRRPPPPRLHEHDRHRVLHVLRRHQQPRQVPTHPISMPVEDRTERLPVTRHRQRPQLRVVRLHD